MSLDKKLESKLIKLYELAKQGVGGEAINANKILNNLLEKHNITLDMLLDIEKKKYFFSYKTDFEKELLFRIISNLKECKDNISYYKTKGKKIGFELTAYEYIETEIQREAYTESWRKYLEQARTAFIVANNLTYFNPDDKKSSKPLTQEEYENIQKILKMSASVPNPIFKRNLLED